MSCSRSGRGCAWKNSSLQIGQVLVSLSQVAMHAEPMTWLQGRRIAASIIPVSRESVLYSSKHMPHCSPSRLTTLDSWKSSRRNASDMLKAAFATSGVLGLRKSYLEISVGVWCMKREDLERLPVRQTESAGKIYTKHSLSSAC